MVQANSVLGLGITPSIVTIPPALGIRNGLGLSSLVATVAAILAAAGFAAINTVSPVLTRGTSAYNPSSDAIVGPNVRRQRTQVVGATSYSSDLIEINHIELLAAGSTERFELWTAANGLTTTADTTAAPNLEVIAQTLTDPGASLSSAQQTFTVANDSLRHVFSIYVLKTAGGTAPTFGITMALTGGTGVTVNARLNTDTGAQQYGSNVNTSVEQPANALWWRFIVYIDNNTTGNTTLTLNVYPAAAAYGASVDDAAATGSAVVTFANLQKAGFASSYVSSRNLLLQTQTLNTTWTKTRTTITSDSTANPIDGAVNADTINEDNTGTNTHFIQQGFTKAAIAQQFTFSAYLKQSGRTWAFVQCTDSTLANGAGIYFDVANGVKGTAVALGTGWTLDASHITAVGAWYRCDITVTTTTATTIRGAVYSATADLGVIIVTPLNAAALICWGTQLVYGAKPMTYWANTTGIGNRQADSLISTGAISTTAGTLLAIVRPYGWTGSAVNQSGTLTFFSSVGTTTDANSQLQGGNSVAVRRTDSVAAGQVNTGLDPLATGVNTTIGMTWGATAVRAYVNGSAAGSVATVPPYNAVTGLEIGNLNGSNRNADGWVLLLYSVLELSASDIAAIQGAIAA